jgi:hypothetical protein
MFPKMSKFTLTPLHPAQVKLPASRVEFKDSWAAIILGPVMLNLNPLFGIRDLSLVLVTVLRRVSVVFAVFAGLVTLEGFIVYNAACE